MQWFRVYHGITANPKWRLIADDSGTSLAEVVAVWLAMLEHASAASQRGMLTTWNERLISFTLDIPSERITAIRKAMQGVTLQDEAVIGWSAKQYENDGSAKRMRKHRDRQRSGQLPEPQESAVLLDRCNEKNSRSFTTDNSSCASGGGACVTSRPRHVTAPDTDRESESKPESEEESAPEADLEPQSNEDCFTQPVDAIENQTDTFKNEITIALAEYDVLAVAKGLPRISKLTPNRRKWLARCLAEHGLNGWRTALAQVRASPFLLGENGRWRANFDFLTNPEKLIATIEGKYADAKQQAKSGRSGRDGFAILALDRLSSGGDSP